MIPIALGKTWPNVIAALRTDPTFRASFAERLRSVPYDAWFWECNRVSRGTFECVVIPAPALAQLKGDSTAFTQHLKSPINTFKNLTDDATLVSPGPPGNYAHFAAFLRFAAPTKVDALFQAVGEAIAAWSGRDPPWVSTAGMGVPWLHVRLDSKPKYYHHAPFKTG